MLKNLYDKIEAMKCQHDRGCCLPECKAVNNALESVLCMVQETATAWLDAPAMSMEIMAGTAVALTPSQSSQIAQEVIGHLQGHGYLGYMKDDPRRRDAAFSMVNHLEECECPYCEEKAEVHYDA